MPKMKTHKSSAARFKVTGTGKLLRRKPAKRHKLSTKTSKRKRSLSHPALVSEGQEKMYKIMLGV